MSITSQEFQEWKDSPVTREILQVLAKRQLQLQEQWVSGQFMSADPLATSIANAGAIARHEALEELIVMTYEDIQTEKADD